MAKRDDDLKLTLEAAFDEEWDTKDKIPLYIVSGTLGAGKTSVLEFLLQQENFKGSRVIENEYANENIDGYRLTKFTDFVTTLAGDCVCCTGDAMLIKTLNDFSKDSGLPVFIEATGVARTINLVERLIKSGIMKKYELAQNFYVISASEFLQPIEKSKQTELQMADIILITKYDTLNDEQKDTFDKIRETIPYENFTMAESGEFNLAKIKTNSGVIGFFDSYEGEVEIPDNPEYSIIDTSNLTISQNAWTDLWGEMAKIYGLRRLKGNFKNQNNETLHIEATLDQLEIKSETEDRPLKLVFIGDEANRITRSSFIAQATMFEK